MNNFIINGVQVSKEQFTGIKKICRLPYEEIGYSYIPPLTDEKIARMKPARLRLKNKKKLHAEKFETLHFCGVF